MMPFGLHWHGCGRGVLRQHFIPIALMLGSGLLVLSLARRLRKKVDGIIQNNSD